VRDFWELLISGRDAVEEVAARRIYTSPWHGLGPSGLDSAANLYGGFLPEVDKFDAGFFGMSAHEAMRLDPQHRMLLETAWEAIEDAGLTADRLAGSRTGVYTSSLSSGYWQLLRAAGALDAYSVMGSGPWEAPAGLISYQFDLRGPSLGIGATCATSLLAVHLACRALWSGEIEIAIVGGASVMIDPAVHAILDHAGVISAAGRSRFGDAGADGYVRGEGVAAVILKPLRQAMADGDTIYAAIAGTGVTHNGRSGTGQFAPGVLGQEQMLRAAYQDAGIGPDEVDYIEAHGAGTASGDLVELQALTGVLCPGRAAERPCLVGSVKSNIGHSEATAGLAGLLKAALGIRAGVIPATLHVHQAHPALDASGGRLALPLSTMRWPERDRPRTAGVSAFGASGTNVHIVLTEAAVPRRRGGRHQGPGLLALSARDPLALRNLARDYADLLAEPGPQAQLRDVCFSAGAHRSHHDFRLAVAGSSREAMAADLRAFASGQVPVAVTRGTRPACEPLQVVFVFPGHGPSWGRAGRELLQASPRFAARMRDCDRALGPELGWLPSRGLADGRPLADVTDSHPMQWALQVCLAAMWDEWGISPDIVVGHSLGEVAAATVTGALDMRDAAAIVCRRSQLLSTLAGRGAMWAVRLDEDTARDLIGEDGGQVCVSVVNSPHSVVIGGEAEATGIVIARLRGLGIACKRLPIDGASHVRLVEEIVPGLREALPGLRPRPARIPMLSTVRNTIIDGPELDAGYWADHLRSPVRFESAVREVLGRAGRTLVVEVSPHPVLLGAVQEIIDACDADATAVASLRRDRPEMESMLAALGQAYAEGSTPKWGKVHPGGRFVPLPRYAWTRQRFWPDGTAGDIAPPAIPAQAPRAELTCVVPAQRTIRSRPGPGGHGAKSAGPDAPAARLAGLSGPRFRQYVLQTVSEVMGVTEAQIDAAGTLMTCGGDSMLALRLRERLLAETGLRVPIRELLGNRTLAELCDDWQERLNGSRAQRLDRIDLEDGEVAADLPRRVVVGQ